MPIVTQRPRHTHRSFAASVHESKKADVETTAKTTRSRSATPELPAAAVVRAAQASRGHASVHQSAPALALRADGPALPRRSRFGLKSTEWAPLSSLFGKAAGGEIHGTFFVGIKNGTPYLQLPLVFAGINRLTPEYYTKVVQPLEQLYAASGRPVESLMDGTDYRPTARELTPEHAQAYVQQLVDSLTQAFAAMGVQAEILPTFKEMPLTPFESRLMAGGRPTKSDAANPDGRMMELLWRGKSKKFRDKNEFTFLLQPVPNLIDSYAATEDYNPTIGTPVTSFLHEMSHYLFMGQYEGYQDAYSPPGAVMGDTAAHRVATRAGQPVAFSAMEQRLILQRIVAALEARGSDTKPLRQKLKQLETELQATASRSVVGKVDAHGAITVAGSGKTLSLDREAYRALFDKADLKKPVHVVLAADGSISHLNAWQKPVRVGDQVVQPGWAKFMPGEMGLTSMFIDGIIQEKSAKR